MQGWEVLSTATGAGEQTNPRPHCQLGGVKPLLFMFPHFRSDVKGFSFSSACAINFKRLLWEECGSDLGMLSSQKKPES